MVLEELFSKHTAVCPICAKVHSATCLNDIEVPEFLRCPECSLKVLNNYYAIIGIIPEKSTNNAVYRTGQVRWIHTTLAGDTLTIPQLQILELQKFIYGDDNLMAFYETVAFNEQNPEFNRITIECKHCKEAPRMCIQYHHPDCAKRIDN